MTPTPYSTLLLQTIEEGIEKKGWPETFSFDDVQKRVSEKSRLVISGGFDSFHSTDFRQKDFDTLVSSGVIVMKGNQYSINSNHSL